MRRIKCLSCNKEWYVRDGEESKVLTCPFCSSPIREKASVSGTDTLGKALYKAIAERSLDILSSSSKISGYLFDIAPELKKETRIFSKTFDDELVSRFRDAFEQDCSEAEITIGMLLYNRTS